MTIQYGKILRPDRKYDSITVTLRPKSEDQKTAIKDALRFISGIPGEDTKRSITFRTELNELATTPFDELEISSLFTLLGLNT